MFNLEQQTGFSQAMIDERKARLQAFWSGESNEPALHKSGWAWPEGFDPQYPVGKNTREAFWDWDYNLQAQLATCRVRSQFRDDWVPMVFPYLGTGVLASAFGCEVNFPDWDQPWTRPIVRCPEDVGKLHQPEPSEGLLGQVLEFTRYLGEAVDWQLPVRVTDIQGPLDTASLIWDYTDFMTSFYEAPEAVAQVLDMVTQLIVDFVKLQEEVVQGEFVRMHCPDFWVPPGKGLSISEDLLATVSPSLYEQFAKPCNERLAREFNGLSVHSCGEFAFNFEHMAATEGLYCADMAAGEADFAKAVEVFTPAGIAISIRVGLTKDRTFATPLDYLEYVFDHVQSQTRLFLHAERGWPPPGCEPMGDVPLSQVEAFLAARGITR